MAHNRDHWFITQATAVWKIPVSHDLAASAAGAPGVLRKGISEFPQLVGYNHFGDPELFSTNGVDYLFVPVTHYESGSGPPIIVVLRGDSLAYVSHARLPTGAESAWCALDPSGRLCLPGGAGVFTFHSVNYAALRDAQRLELGTGRPFVLNDERGAPILDIDFHQGGVISPSGELLFVVAGFHDQDRPGDGIHVFTLTVNPASGLVTTRRIRRSTQASRPFAYQVSTGIDGEEPEGITFWDLNDGRSPGVQGEVHVLVLDNGFVGEDDVYIKHYTSAIHADRRFLGAEWGIPSNPFNTITEAYNYAWAGADLKIKTGLYPESLSFERSVRIRAEGGPITIGR